MTDSTRRRQNLERTAKLLFLVALGFLVFPFLASFFPAADESEGERTRPGLLVDLADLAPGAVRQVVWKGYPVWIYRRTRRDVEGVLSLAQELADLNSVFSVQPAEMRNPLRSLRPEYFVFVPLETKRSCQVHYVASDHQFGDSRLAWYGGFTEPCYGARFDLAGRIYRDTGMGEQQNLTIPPYRFVSDTQIELLL